MTLHLRVPRKRILKSRTSGARLPAKLPLHMSRRVQQARRLLQDKVSWTLFEVLRQQFRHLASQAGPAERRGAAGRRVAAAGLAEARHRDGRAHAGRVGDARVGLRHRIAISGATTCTSVPQVPQPWAASKAMVFIQRLVVKFRH